MRGRFLLPALVIVCSLGPDADAQVCGRVDGAPASPRASDAQAALRASVGIAGVCRLCLCDVDGSGGITSADALAILRKVVEIPVTFSCADCTCPIPRRLAVGEHPRVVRVADLDRDGDVDLVSADDESRSISVLLGLGHGAFAERRAIDAGGAPMSVTVVDVDGDQILDLVTANLDPSAIAIFEGNGDGTFAAPRLLGSGDSPVHVAVADISGDGRADLLAVNSLSNDVSVYLADGTGGFSQRPRVAVGIGPRWIELADLTGDGKLDAVVANRDSHSVTILPGNGDGTFADSRTIHVCAGAHQALPVDLNGDSTRDLVVACKAERALAVLLATGNGSFASPHLYETRATAIAAAVGDLDADGKPDVAVSTWYAGALVLFRGEANGTLVEASRAFIPGKPRGVSLDDVTGDSVADIVVTSTESADLLLFPGIGRPSLRTQFEGVRFRPRVRDLAPADLDRDGSLDFVAANWHALSGAYARDDGARFAYKNLIDIPRFPSAVITGDFNGDGKPDFIVKNNKVWAVDAGKRCTDPHLAVFFGHGDLTFEPELRVAAANLSHHTDDDFAGADVNGDRIDDLLIIERQSAAVTYMRGQQNGQFEVVQRIPVEGTAAHLAVGDLNADRAPDIAWVQGAEGRDLIVRLRDEFLRFGLAPSATFVLGSPASWLLIGDVNSDGRGDLVSGVAANTFVETRLARQDATFDAPIRSNLGQEFFKAPELIDADVDGALDLVGLQNAGPFDPNLPFGGPPMIAKGAANGSFAAARIIDPADLVPFFRYQTTALLARNVDADPPVDFLVTYQSNKDRASGILVYNVGNCLDPEAAP